MIELIIRKFATMTLTVLRGVSRTPATPKVELSVILVYDRCSICSKSAVKIPKRSQRLLLSLILTLNRFHASF